MDRFFEQSDQSSDEDTITIPQKQSKDQKINAYIILLGIEDAGKSALMRQLVAMFEIGDKSSKGVSGKEISSVVSSFCHDTIYDNIINTTAVLLQICVNSTPFLNRLSGSDTILLENERALFTEVEWKDIHRLNLIFNGNPRLGIRQTVYSHPKVELFQDIIRTLYTSARIIFIIEVCRSILRRNEAQEYILKHIENFYPYEKNEIQHAWKILYPGYPKSEMCPKFSIRCQDGYVILQDFHGGSATLRRNSEILFDRIKPRTVCFVVDLQNYVEYYEKDLSFLTALQAEFIHHKVKSVHCIFTKVDLFREKLLEKSFKGCFPKFDTSHNELDFISHLFEQRTKKKSDGIQFYSYFVNCLDITMVENTIVRILDRDDVYAPFSRKYLENKDHYKKGVYLKIPPEFMVGRKIYKLKCCDSRFNFEEP